MEERIEEYLQQEYKEYVKRYKDNSYDLNHMNFERWYQEYQTEYSDLFVCNACNEVCTKKGTSELALTDCICKDCMQSGYGR